MKYLKIIIATMLGTGLLSCGNNNHSSVTKEAATPGATASTGSNASFSVIIDGVPVSGGAIDELQITNTAFIYPAAENSPQRVLFLLNSNKKGDDFYGFRFSFPDKEGVFKFTHETGKTCHCSLYLDNNLRSSDNFSRYDESSVTVSIDKITSTRISGTFSGTLKLSDDTRSKPYPKQSVLTEGKFDIPFSTGNLRPE